MLALRQRAAEHTPSTKSAPAEQLPASTPAAEAVRSSERTKNFILADMEGRSTRDNRACSSCIRKLAPREIGQVNWHVSQDQACRLCQVAEEKPEAFTKPFCDFLQENPTIFHAVDYFKTKLAHAGYKEVRRQMRVPLPSIMAD